ncbi:hypothetical protein NOCARDAX2BIS_460037 [Nocardioides sp. AX2bis]|nr:hypothetical protein NOCARDAX2BIS_460037 [Nocardioides sp. AX2bis]
MIAEHLTAVLGDQPNPKKSVVSDRQEPLTALRQVRAPTRRPGEDTHDPHPARRREPDRRAWSNTRAERRRC